MKINRGPMPPIEHIKPEHIKASELVAAKLATVLITGAIVCVVGITRYWRRKKQQQHDEYKKKDTTEDLANTEGFTQTTTYPDDPSSLPSNVAHENLDNFVALSQKSRGNGADDNGKTDPCGTTRSEPEGDNQVSEEQPNKKKLTFALTSDNLREHNGDKQTNVPDDDDSRSDISYASSERSARSYTNNSRLAGSKITF